MKKIKYKALKAIFSVLIVIFIIILGYFLMPSLSFKRSVFPVIAVLAFAFCFLGIVLTILTIKQKIKGKLKWFLILTGVCSSGFLASVFLHNFFYALGILAENIIVLKYLMEALHVVFFLTGIFGCPIGFLVGIIGSIILMLKKE